MSFVRYLLIALLILAPIWVSSKFVPHHVDDSPFLTLYQHVVPENLVRNAHEVSEAHHTGAHVEPEYVKVPLPFALPLNEHIDLDKSTATTDLGVTNLQLFQLAAVLLVIVCFSGVPGYLRTGKGDKVSQLFAGFATWVRDEMVYPVMGKEVGAKFLPYLFTLFFFVLFMNLLGLVPGAATATASIFVTAALATTTLVTMVGGGMIAQGPVAYFKNLVPHVPLLMWPLMFVVEIVGVVVKPFALMIRLFANMTGGHLVVLSFMGLLFLLAKGAGSTAAYSGSPLVVAFAVFIMIVESFVALLQAYVFTMLSILFIQASIHPEH